MVAACYFISAFACFFVQQWWELLAARFIGGLAIGGTSVVTPMYIAEISPPRLRGRLVMINQLAIVLGIFFCFISNYVIACHYSFEVAWRWMFGVLAFPSIVFFLSIFWILESPRSLVKRGRLADAKGRSGGWAKRTSTAPWRPSRRRSPIGRDTRKSNCFGILTGDPCCCPSPWPSSTNSPASTPSCTIPRRFQQGRRRGERVPAAIHRHRRHAAAFTIVAMFVIDRFGRRILLLIGSLGMTACLALVAGAFATAQHGTLGHPRLVLAGLIGSIAFFAMSQGAVMFVFISEVFPNAVRAKGQAFGTLVHWIMDMTGDVDLPGTAALSVAGVFGFFAVMMVLQFVFVWRSCRRPRASPWKTWKNAWRRRLTEVIIGRPLLSPPPSRSRKTGPGRTGRIPPADRPSQSRQVVNVKRPVGLGLPSSSHAATSACRRGCERCPRAVARRRSCG